MSAGRAVWVKVRASEAERAEWHAKARAAGLTLSDLVRRSVGRTRTWTVAHARGRARARPPDRTDREQPQPDRSVGEHPPGGHRGGRGDRSPRRHQAGARGAGSRREFGRGCWLGSWPAGRARRAPRPTTSSASGTRPGSRARASKSFGAIRTKWPAVADSLEFEHRYTSGVIAWAPEDEPTDAEIEAVVDAFEDTAWAGLEPDRYAWAAVLHRERGGGAHVHVLAARCDPGDRPEPQHCPAGLGEDLRPAPGRLQPRTRLGSPGRPPRGLGCSNPATAPTSRRHGCGPGLRLESSPRDLIRDYLLQRRRARCGQRPRRCRLRTAGSGSRSAAPGQALPHRARPRDRGPVAAERRTVWRELRPPTI